MAAVIAEHEEQQRAEAEAARTREAPSVDDARLSDEHTDAAHPNADKASAAGDNVSAALPLVPNGVHTSTSIPGTGGPDVSAGRYLLPAAGWAGVGAIFAAALSMRRSLNVVTRIPSRKHLRRGSLEEERPLLPT